MLERIPDDEGVAIKRLRLPRLRHDGIRADEPPQRRVVVAGPVVVQPRALVQPLAGELVGGGRGAVGVAGLAPGFVAQLRHPLSPLRRLLKKP